MQVVEKVIPYHWGDVFNVYPFGDQHQCTKYCVEDKVLEKVEEIRRNPLALWFGVGDMGEFIAPSDPRWDTGVICDWVHPDNIAEDETDRIVETYSSIKDKCLGLAEGNHEDEFRKHLHCDVHRNICTRLDVPSLGYAGFLRLVFKRINSTEAHTFIGFVTHGAGCAITKGAKLNRLQRLMDSFEADFYAHGHVHDIITDTKATLTLDNRGRIKQRVKVGAMTGCWFRTYCQDIRASYGEKKNYPPTVIGCPVFVIDPGAGTVRVRDE
jgi:hypothetical protein